MSMADPLISDERLAEIGAQHDDFCWWLADQGFDPTMCDGRAGVFDTRQCPIRHLLAETARLRSHNAYLTEMFYGIASLKVCDRHNAVPIVDRARHDRVVDPACQDCRADDLAHLAAGNVEATTLAQRYRACQDRNLALALENRRLKDAARRTTAPGRPEGEG